MKKAQRLIDLMIMMNANRRWTLRQLADELHVSKRTIQRDLTELEELGFPLYAEYGAHGGYHALPNRMLPPVSLTTEEAVSVFFAAQMLQYYGALPYEHGMLSTLNKFAHGLPDDTKSRIEQMKQRFLFWAPTHDTACPFLEPLLEASLHTDVLDMTYESETQVADRVIQPIGVYAMNGHWYCPAYCFTREEMRVFRVDRIHRLVPNVSVPPRSDIAKWSVEDYLRSQFDDGNALPLIVQLTRRGVLKCKSDFWLAPGVEERADGSGTLRAKVPAGMVDWTASYFLALGSDAVVEQPDEIRWHMKKQIQQLSAQYLE